MSWFYCDVDVSRQPGETTITRYPTRGLRIAVAEIWFSAWLVGWGAAEFMVGRMVVLGLPYKGIANVRHDPVTWCWLIVWTIVGTALAAQVYAMIFARPQSVTLSGDEIIASYPFGHWRRSKRWQVSQIGAMRFRKQGRRGAIIQFDYEGRTQQLLPASDLVSTQRMLEEISANLTR